jgi:glycosyltransferase involved in cell wall biosynthesis
MMMKRAVLRLSDAAVFTVPMENISWIKRHPRKGHFIPVGANLPTSSEANSRKDISTGGKLSVAVFGITGGEAGGKEIEKIVEAVRFAASRVGNLRLIVLGRNAQSAEVELRNRFRDSTVELHVLGVLSGEDVVRSLSVSDVLLFVRGHISTRRGSAIAGIACGLPVIAFEGPETAAPITEAGLALFSPQRKGDLGDVLVRVLEDEHYRASLAQRSWVAQRQYFSCARLPRVTRNSCGKRIRMRGLASGERNPRDHRHKASIKTSFFSSASLVKASSEAK